MATELSTRDFETELAEARRKRIEREWPELTLFYGISPLELAKLPRWLRQIYIDALPRLRAQQQLRLIEAMSVPWMEDASRTKVFTQLQTMARPKDAPLPGDTGAQFETIEEAQAALAGVGIGVTVVDKDGKEVASA